jgi:uncharacterized protein with ATP-grasp and redox domains
MKSCLDCIPCFFDQALRTGRMATNDERKIKGLLDEVGMMLKNIPLESTPPETGRLIQRKIREVIGNSDPYKDIKHENIQKSLRLYSHLKREVERSNDRLLTAIRIAIAGNVIDLGPNKSFNIEEDLDEILRKDFAICDHDSFKQRLVKTDDILYIGDNAGESVFDKVLIEEMRKPVTYVVRGTPVINDVTYQDAIEAGLDKVATILSSGTDAAGTVLETCNDEFKEIYRNSDLIISKGQGNYEALSEEKRPIFFLLKAKCRVIADDIGVNEDDIILKGPNTDYAQSQMWRESTIRYINQGG